VPASVLRLPGKLDKVDKRTSDDRLSAGTRKPITISQLFTILSPGFDCFPSAIDR